MLGDVNFRCNFCGKRCNGLDEGEIWTKARYQDPNKNSPTTNDLFNLEWTDKPLHNLKGSHICSCCVDELVKIHTKSNPKPKGKTYVPWKLFMCDQETGLERMLMEGNELAMRNAAKKRPDDDVWLVNPNGEKEVP